MFLWLVDLVIRASEYRNVAGGVQEGSDLADVQHTRQCLFMALSDSVMRVDGWQLLI